MAADGRFLGVRFWPSGHNLFRLNVFRRKNRGRDFHCGRAVEALPRDFAANLNRSLHLVTFSLLLTTISILQQSAARNLTRVAGIVDKLPLHRGRHTNPPPPRGER